ncbi:MAG TPA: transglycosylase family protein [Jatrophihabitans sp.]|nr:transglycosylase family protein [Jatrophihabitans sp.]
MSAAAVIGTVLAGPAGAAPNYAVWDRVAHCESTNNWHINTGNGYYGGLQFSASTWAAYGGHRYAGQANGASRLQQIEVARRVLASQGPHAWPVCGPRAGLNRYNGQATHAPLPRVAGQRAHVARQSARKMSHPAPKVRRHAHGTYRVRRGDTLSSIARIHHVAGGWRALFRANRDRLWNPNVVRAGQVLVLP